jgi:hypothetical protein
MDVMVMINLADLDCQEFISFLDKTYGTATILVAKEIPP